MHYCSPDSSKRICATLPGSDNIHNRRMWCSPTWIDYREHVSSVCKLFFIAWWSKWKSVAPWKGWKNTLSKYLTRQQQCDVWAEVNDPKHAKTPKWLYKNRRCLSGDILLAKNVHFGNMHTHTHTHTYIYMVCSHECRWALRNSVAHTLASPWHITIVSVCYVSVFVWVCACFDFKEGRLEIVSSSWVVADEGGVPLGGVDAWVARARQAGEWIQSISLQVGVT